MSESAEFPRHPRDGVERLVEEVRALRREVSELRNNLLKQAGMSVEPDLVRFGGAVAIEGTLSLPAGIIDNDALANPVTFDADFGHGSGYATPSGAWLEVAAASITIPAGFTRLQFTAAAMANGLNSSGSTANMYVQIIRTIDGGGSYSSQQGQIALPAGFQGVASTFYLWNEAATPGEEHRFSLQVWTSAAFEASEYNYARVDVSALYRR